MAHTVLLEHLPDLHRPAWGIAAVRIDEQRDLFTQDRPHAAPDVLGTSGPFVVIVAALLPDPHLERVESVSLPEGGESSRLVRRSDVAAHARLVRTQGSRAPAEELADGLSLELASEIPERGLEPGEGAEEVRAVKLVLALRDVVDERLDVERVAAECVRSDLAVEDLSRDVGVKGSDLPPAFGSLVRADTHDRDVLVPEGVDARDPHSRSKTITFLSASPCAAAIASLIRASG